MSETFVVGDVHGCTQRFDELLARCGFRADRDRLWLVGDIVNRGPDSLGMLRRAIALEHQLGERFVMVLGNHEIHLLNVAHGLGRLRGKDTLTEILKAGDKDHLLKWLCNRPLVHAAQDHLLVHAGLRPDWTLAQAIRKARKIEAILRGADAESALRKLQSSQSLRTLTRIRMLDPDGEESAFNGPPEEAATELEPWFNRWQNQQAGDDAATTVLFGHWAALGHRKGGEGDRRWIALDSGCVYGRSLSAIRLSDHRQYSVKA